MQVAVYDVASATWGAADTLQADFSASDATFGAVDADGNALVVYVLGDHVAVQRYDATAGRGHHSIRAAPATTCSRRPRPRVSS